MVQVRRDEVVCVGPVRDRFVAAAGAMRVVGFVSPAGVRRRAVLGIRARYFDVVLVDVSLVHEVKVTVVEVIDVPQVVNGCMRTAVGMFMRVVVVSCVPHAPSIQP